MAFDKTEQYLGNHGLYLGGQCLADRLTNGAHWNGYVFAGNKPQHIVFHFIITRFKVEKSKKFCGSHIAQQAMPNSLFIIVWCTPAHRIYIYPGQIPEAVYSQVRGIISSKDGWTMF